MITIKNEKDCCGCFACKEVCPSKCIEEIEGSLGHLFPKVDFQKCIKCNKCVQVCPIQNNSMNITNQCAYVAFSKDAEVRKISSSGGMFYSLAEQLLNEGYKVYGAGWDEYDLQLSLRAIDEIKDLPLLCKSKYLQSSMIGNYKQIEGQLKAGVKIMVCGTPCQIKALKNYIKKPYDNLFLVDFFCHGVPSQKYFNQCKELFEKQNNARVKTYSFRTKIHNGVTPHYYTISYEKNNKTIIKKKLYYNSKFYAAFQSYINLRESCYDCLFHDENRGSDITIGDFHNVNKYYKQINRMDGVSLLITNTTKGENVFNSIKNKLVVKETNIEMLKETKEIFFRGTLRPSKRDDFIRDYETMPFEKLNKKWFSKTKYIKQIIYYHLPKFGREILKKIVRI